MTESGPTVSTNNGSELQHTGDLIGTVATGKAASIEATTFDGDAPTVEERDFKRKQVFKGGLLFWLAYQACGVVYGDIGTSPLYVYSSTFTSNPSPDDLLGVLSIIIWTLTLIVSIKYSLIVLCADDAGEGGTFALYSLLSRYSNIMKRDPKTQVTVKLERYLTEDLKPSERSVRSFLENSIVAHVVLKALAVFGVSLVMADGVLTPAQSVLGAIQGLEVIDPTLSNGTIVGVSCAILVVLFMLQPLGITKLGSVFAPIVIVWLLFNFAFGIYNLVVHDATVLKAFSPYFAGHYFVRNGTEGWKSLGGILLAFTGVEALFADLGAFSKRAIQLSWLLFAFPCLLMAYIGQAAYIMQDPSAYSNPFFRTVPPGMYYPSLVVSILAAIVASQALVTSTFLLLSQVINMSYFPPVKKVYTSNKFFGQVYIPIANWLLMIGTVVVTAVYNNTTSLGHAYGVCVILVTFITTAMVTLIAILVWRIHFLLVIAVAVPFLTLDGLYLSSALTKVPEGAWFTLVLALILSSIFVLWRFGKEEQWATEGDGRSSLSQPIVKDASDGTEYLHTSLGGGALTRFKGLGIFFDKIGGTAPPTVCTEFLQKFVARPRVHIFLHLRALSIPTVAQEEKYTVSVVKGIDNCYRVLARHGYNDEIVTRELASTVYAEVRKFILRSSHHFSSSTSREVAQRAGGNGGSVQQRKPGGNREVKEIEEFDATSLPTAALDPDADKTIVAAVSALDQAFNTQKLYIVGKEELRVLAPANKAWSDYLSGNAVRRFFLHIFLWIRENTRAKVASMRIPVDQLVEVGFVKEM